MSRHGYSDDCEGWELIMWRGAVASAIRGQRGQSFLRELLIAMDIMPSKRLIERELIDPVFGEVCAIGVVCKSRGIDVADIDPEDSETIAKTVGISEALAKEIEYENDDGTCVDETPEQRWTRVRKWVAGHIHEKPNQGVEPVASTRRTDDVSKKKES